MPIISPKHVVSFSSEDKVQCADNLLKPESYRKWRTSSGGENQAHVVLQLEKSEQIHSIDIGNEGSTFVEVLVGDSDAEVKIDFQVLLGASALMTPAEAKGWTNLNKVRMFGPAALNKTTSDKKWSRVKIVVTQNFNKSEPFGLAFVKLHSPPDNSSAEPKEGKKFGKFSLKDEGSSSPKPLQAGSLFDRVKREPETKPPADSVAAIRLGTSSALSADNGRLGTSLALQISPKPTGMFKLKTEESFVNRNPFTSPPPPPPFNSTPHKQTDFLKTEPKADCDDILSRESDVKPFLTTPQPSRPNGAAQSVPRKRPSPSHPSSEPSASKKPKTVKPAASVPFNQVLKGVTFVLSGYQNPLRGIVRDKALAMGAKYKPDWDQDSTHLICAFSNTPKYTQVLGKGKIVTKRWIEDCHVEKRRIPWRDYRLDDGSEGSDSDDGEGGVSGSQRSKKPVKQRQNGGDSHDSGPATGNESDLGGSDRAAATKNGDDSRENGVILSRKDDSETENCPVIGREEEEEDEYAGTTDVDSDVEEDSRRPGGHNDDDPDTEDELQRIMDKSKDIPKPKLKPEDEASLPPLPTLPSFFKGKQFLLFGSIEPSSRKQLSRFIIAYGGQLQAYMTASIDFVVTTSTWDEEFDEATEQNPDIHFVRPKWLKMCHQKLKLVPYQPYIVAPPLDDDDDDD